MGIDIDWIELTKDGELFLNEISSLSLGIFFQNFIYFG